MKPVVKWAGGKKRLINEIKKNLPNKFNKYLEPFLGGAAVLLEIEPELALVNDLNDELINMYEVIKSRPLALIEQLRNHEVEHEKNPKEHYYFVRSLDIKVGLKNLSKVYRAGRLIYLNKTGYNGLYRVNSLGYYNVPSGKKLKVNLFDERNILELSEYFKTSKVHLSKQDYYDFVLNNVEQGDFVYLDPPYDVPDNGSSFTSYQKGGFDKKEQQKLFELCKYIDGVGAKFLLSNSNTLFINELYRNDFEIIIVSISRNIGSDVKTRGVTTELLIKNY